MNLIDTTIIRNNFSTVLKNWTDTTILPQTIDSVTYDLYENNNPFRKTFTKDEIQNREARFFVNTGTAMGAELFSVFANPYYLTHKITQVPAAYTSVINTYKKYSGNQQ